MDFTEFLSTTVGKNSLSTLLAAIALFVGCIFVLRLLTKMLRRLLERTSLDKRIQRYLLTTVKVVLYILTGIIVADHLNINMSSLVALLSVVSLGLTLAAEDILGNAVGGLIIMGNRPFSAGDYIEVGGVYGAVDEVTLNYTKIITLDDQLVMLPNQELANSQIMNYSALGRRRVGLKVSASYDTPTQNVMDACYEAISLTGHVMDSPSPIVRISAYGESAIEYTLFCWCHPARYWDTYFTLNENLREAFARHDAVMTYDHLNVHIVEKQSQNS